MHLPETRRIAVIGGGISGLAAAHRFRELAPQCQVTLFEAGSRLGGVVSTVHRDGFQVEQSADNFITTVPWGLDLCQRLGLTGQLVQTNSNCRRTFVVRRGRLHRLPDGFLMMAPTQLWPMAVTPILSPLGKLRAALEYFIPPRRDDDDESMAQFVRRRLGRETFDRLVEPLISAVYAADMEKLSVKATLSRFREMEKQHGSLIRAMRQQMKHKPNGHQVLRVGGKRRSVQHVRDVVRRARHAGRGDHRTIAAGIDPSEFADRDRSSAAATSGGYFRERRRAGAGQFLEFDALIVAVPAHRASPLLAPIDAELAAELGQIEYSGTAIVSLGYDCGKWGIRLDGMGAVVPSIENSPILACSFSSQKYPHRAPAGKTLLRVFVGGARRPDLAEMPDAELLPLVLKHLRPLLRIEGEPVFCDIAHWPRTMPQYHVGHQDVLPGSRPVWPYCPV